MKKLISHIPLWLYESIRSIVVVDMTTFLYELFLLTEAIERFSSSFANYPLIAG
jgi:hypothetical protein